MNTITEAVPLCVDLDDTLVRTNTLIETIVGALRQNPAWIFLIPFWALRGKAYLWAALEPFRPDAAVLPYSEPVLDLVRNAKAEGRPVVLATGAHERVARDVARHLDLSGIFATNGRTHLVDGQKAAALVARFGVKGFDYIGDSAHDIAIFRNCRQAYVVSSSPKLARHLRKKSVLAIAVRTDSRLTRWSALFSAMRPKQWMKNLLVFGPLLLGHRFTDRIAVLHSVFTCLLLCMSSSAVYLVNDIIDLEADRRHHKKRVRPFAQGTVPIRWGVFGSILLATTALGLGLLVNPAVAVWLAAYLAATMLYSVWLKQLLIIDMVFLASFYIFRVYLGSAATGIVISSWTALFCLFVFSSLAAVKRYAEIYNRAAEASQAENRRAYLPDDAAPLLAMGTSGFVGAIVALGLYLGSPDVGRLYSRPELLWLICPVLLGWSGRLWILAHRGELNDEDPVAFALRDRWSLGAALVCAAIFFLAL
jgi:4-hydroxybenzoate polyprenyltransferase/phosphoserine phosphatase